MTATTTEGATWRDKAVCADLDPVTADAIFYPTNGGPGPGGGRANYRRAAAICERCPVVGECLAATLAWEAHNPGRHGYAGGKTPNERAALAATLMQGEEEP